MSSVTIGEAGRRCAQAFVKVTEIPNDRVVIRDQLSRFKIWAGNLGVFANGSLSADFRLRNHGDIRDVILKLLERLEKRLDLVKSDTVPPSVETPQKSLGDASSGESSVDDSDGSSLSENSSEPDVDIVLPVSPIKRIEEIITNLYRITAVIKKPVSSREDDLVRAWSVENARYLQVELADLRSYLSWWTERQFPHVSGSLRARITDTSVQRRKRLLYRKQHRTALEHDTHQWFTPRNLASVANPMNRSKHTIPLAQTNFLELPGRAAEDRLVGIQEDQASSVPTRGFSQRAKSVVLSDITPSLKQGLDHLDVPPLPKPESSFAEVVCPYCSRPLKKDIQADSSGLHWRRHVLQDIDPYVCIFEQCETPNRCYKTKDDWVSHMTKQHTAMWSCQTKSHTDCLFTNPEDLAAHFREEHHDDIPEEHIPFMLEKGKKPMPDPFAVLASKLESYACPFAGPSCSERVEAFTMTYALHVPEFPEAAYRQIRDHIASHLEAVALLSLPLHEGTSSRASSERVLDDHRQHEQADLGSLPSPIFEDPPSQQREETIPFSDESPPRSPIEVPEHLHPNAFRFLSDGDSGPVPQLDRYRALLAMLIDSTNAIDGLCDSYDRITHDDRSFNIPRNVTRELFELSILLLETLVKDETIDDFVMRAPTHVLIDVQTRLTATKARLQAQGLGNAQGRLLVNVEDMMSLQERLVDVDGFMLHLVLRVLRAVIDQVFGTTGIFQLWSVHGTDGTAHSFDLLRALVSCTRCLEKSFEPSPGHRQSEEAVWRQLEQLDAELNPPKIRDNHQGDFPDLHIHHPDGLHGTQDSSTMDADWSFVFESDQERGSMFASPDQDSILQHFRAMQFKKLDLDRLKIAPNTAYNIKNDDRGTVELILPGTQNKILEEILQWIDDPQGGAWTVLEGAAGSGKTTLCRTIASILDKRGQLGASFFLDRSDAQDAQATLLFPTIAVQLASKLPFYHEVLTEELEKLGETSAMDIAQQFEYLIRVPLSRWQERGVASSQVVVVVDAMDEYFQIHERSSILGHLDSWPSCLKILFTSRQDTPSGAHSSFVLLPVLSDLSRYLDHKMVNPHDDWLSFKTVIAHALLTACAEAERSRISTTYHDVDVIATLLFQTDDLHTSKDDWLKITSSIIRNESGLSDTLSTCFCHAWLHQVMQKFDEAELANRTEFARTIFGAMIVLFTPLSAEALGQLLNMTQEKVLSWLAPFASILRSGWRRNLPVEFAHHSVPELLLKYDGEKDVPLLETRESHSVNLLANIYLLLKGDLRKGVTSISEALEYACRNWTRHSLQVFQIWQKRALQDLFDFLSQSFHLWLEAMAGLGCEADSLLDSIQQLLDAVEPMLDKSAGEGIIPVLKTLKLLREGIDIVRQFWPTVKAFPDQLHRGVLIFTSNDSLMKQCFRDEVPEDVQFISIVRPTPSNVLSTSVENATKDQARALCFSPDSTILAIGTKTGMISLSSAWKNKSSKDLSETIERTIHGHEQEVTSLAFSSDGRLLLSGSADTDANLKVWNTLTGDLVSVISGHKAGVRSVAFSPDDKTIASGSSDGTYRLWNTSTCDELARFELTAADMIRIVFAQNQIAIAFRTLINTIRFLSSDGSSEAREIGTRLSLPSRVDFSSNARLMAINSDNETIEIWDLDSLQLHRRLIGRKGIVSAMSISADGRVLASISSSDGLLIWDVDGQMISKQLHMRQVVTSMTLSPDGHQLALLLQNGRTVLYQETARESIGTKSPDHGALEITALAFSEDGRSLASAARNGIIAVSHTYTGSRQWDYVTNSVILDLAFERGTTLVAGSQVFDLMGILPDPRSQSHVLAGYRIDVMDGWVLLQGKPVLCLPKDYRDTCWAVRNDLLAVASRAGLIAILRFHMTASDKTRQIVDSGSGERKLMFCNNCGCQSHSEGFVITCIICGSMDTHIGMETGESSSRYGTPDQSLYDG